MKITNDRDERRAQKEILSVSYPDYDPKRHDAFVMRYNTDVGKIALNNYMQNRGLK